jgi:hypothetical protein
MPSYQLRLDYAAFDTSSAGHLEEDEQSIRFLRPEEYTTPSHYVWPSFVVQTRYQGLGIPNDPFIGTNRNHLLVHRGPTIPAGDSAWLSVDPAFCYSALLTLFQRPFFQQETDGPAITVSLLEFEEPRTVTELLSYRGSSLPPVRRVLAGHTFPVDTAFPVSLVVNLDGARLIGLETSPPPTPETLGPPAFWRADTSCSATATISVPR